MLHGICLDKRRVPVNFVTGHILRLSARIIRMHRIVGTIAPGQFHVAICIAAKQNSAVGFSTRN